jgi:predicted nucleic acid-binding protein
MPINQVVINASPLIVLYKSGQVDLLPQLFESIIVPQAVYDEITAIKSDVAATQLPSATWYRQTAVQLNQTIVAWDLGAGESAVLSFALANPGYRAMVDDTAARRCARALGIATLGTGGAIVLAKQRGLISSVSDRLQHLKDAGLWLSEDVVNLLKQQAGET